MRFNDTHWPLMMEAFYQRVQGDPHLLNNPDALVAATIDWVENTVR